MLPGAVLARGMSYASVAKSGLRRRQIAQITRIDTPLPSVLSGSFVFWFSS
jgi:hypothetical protein